MDKIVKTIIFWVLVFGAIAAAGYVGYRLYNYMVTDATQRIKQGAAEGVSKGISEGIGGTVKDLPGKLFDGK